jgi:predicted RNA-binding Zn-ribbon protein involved in translation (DUF1610 family)
MLKLTTNHDNYEVWCEHTAESVFVDHRPTPQELVEIHKKEQWPFDSTGNPVPLRVDKIHRFYTAAAPRKTPRKCFTCDGEGKTNKCTHCGGAGMKSDDSYSSFPCPWCEKGRVKTISKCHSCGGTGKQKPIEPLYAQE